MSIFNFERMTSALIILSGIFFISCGDKAKSKEEVAVAPGKRIETVAEARSPVGRETGKAIVANRADDTEVVISDKKYTQSLDHSSWNRLLQKYVDGAGNVDYESFKEDTKGLDEYLGYLSGNVPNRNGSKNDKLAYYINLYNAATVKLILDNYPVKSIKDINAPWDKKWVKVGEELLSLGHIEHKILRKMNEPRIHFAINCASYSCPKLLNEAFTATKMESQLQMATIDFIADTTRNRISDEKLQLSNIFKWYKKDFTTSGSLKDYLNLYSDTSIMASAKIEYLKYDWSLNEIK